MRGSFLLAYLPGDVVQFLLKSCDQFFGFLFPVCYFPDIYNASQKTIDARRVCHIDGKAEFFHLLDRIFSVTVGSGND